MAELAAFEENRHPPFAPGNEMHRSHGARAQPWRLAGRSQEIADEIRLQVEGVQPSDDFLIRLLALALTRIELASAWLESHPEKVIDGRGRSVSLLADLRSWESQAAKHLAALGLTPQARSRARESSPAQVLSDYLESRVS